jgi:hypothetical protein
MRGKMEYFLTRTEDAPLEPARHAERKQVRYRTDPDPTTDPPEVETENEINLGWAVLPCVRGNVNQEYHTYRMSVRYDI